jgi:hypothetical protein
MKTSIKTIGLSLLIACTSVLTITSCKKEKKEEVAPAPTPAASTAKISAAIDARVGTFTIEGTVDTAVYTASNGKRITITKVGETKIRIAPVNFSMGTFEFEVKNGAVVSGGVVSGNEDGKAIGYTGSSSVGQITFGCEEDNTFALVVSGTGINSVQIGGNK